MKSATIITALVILAIGGLDAPNSVSAEICSAPHLEATPDSSRFGLPPHVEKSGLVFTGTTVPISRRDVQERIVKEINYLLLDRRSRVLLWLARADTLRPVILPILKKYDVPPEFLYLAAIESSYDSRALSSAGAYGYWQFIKATAQCGPHGCEQYNWKMNINHWKDERADLVNSTHSAAKYLAWMNGVKKVSLSDKVEREGFKDWLLTAAAYNAGPSRVVQRLCQFGASSYWDVPLPIETEKYVPRLIALALISKYRDFYRIQIHQRPSLAFETVNKVKLHKDLSFVAMAKLLNTTPREVWGLNTQVPPDKGIFPAKSGKTSIEHTIHIPKGTRQKFLAQLAAHGFTKK
ncbi:MAG: lytic transglycosylase domain-containing protein [Desulfomonile tiedjei]|nr:lytic transglycosylase domain-containing protein [Desulfomonile tiedjei]